MEKKLISLEYDRSSLIKRYILATIQKTYSNFTISVLICTTSQKTTVLIFNSTVLVNNNKKKIEIKTKK